MTNYFISYRNKVIVTLVYQVIVCRLKKDGLMRYKLKHCQTHICTETAGQPNEGSNNMTFFFSFSSWFYIGVARLITSPLVDRPTRKTPTSPDGLSTSDCQYLCKRYSEWLNNSNRSIKGDALFLIISIETLKLLEMICYRKLMIKRIVVYFRKKLKSLNKIASKSWLNLCSFHRLCFDWAKGLEQSRRPKGLNRIQHKAVICCTFSQLL